MDSNNLPLCGITDDVTTNISSNMPDIKASHSISRESSYFSNSATNTSAIESLISNYCSTSTGINQLNNSVNGIILDLKKVLEYVNDKNSLKDKETTIQALTKEITDMQKENMQVLKKYGNSLKKRKQLSYHVNELEKEKLDLENRLKEQKTNFKRKTPVCGANKNSMTVYGSDFYSNIQSNGKYSAEELENISEGLLLSLDQVQRVFGPMCIFLLKLESEFNVSFKVQSMDMFGGFAVAIKGHKIFVHKAKDYILKKIEMSQCEKTIDNAGYVNSSNYNQSTVSNKNSTVAHNQNAHVEAEYRENYNQCGVLNKKSTVAHNQNVHTKAKYVSQRFVIAHHLLREILYVNNQLLIDAERISGAIIECHPSTKAGENVCYIHIKGTLLQFKHAQQLVFEVTGQLKSKGGLKNLITSPKKSEKKKKKKNSTKKKEEKSVNCIAKNCIAALRISPRTVRLQNLANMSHLGNKNLKKTVSTCKVANKKKQNIQSYCAVLKQNIPKVQTKHL